MLVKAHNDAKSTMSTWSNMNWMHALPTADAMYPIRIQCCDEDAQTLSCFNLTPIPIVLRVKEEEILNDPICPVSLMGSNAVMKMSTFFCLNLTPIPTVLRVEEAEILNDPICPVNLTRSNAMMKMVKHCLVLTSLLYLLY